MPGLNLNSQSPLANTNGKSTREILRGRTIQKLTALFDHSPINTPLPVPISDLNGKWTVFLCLYSTDWSLQLSHLSMCCTLKDYKDSLGNTRVYFGYILRSLCRVIACFWSKLYRHSGLEDRRYDAVPRPKQRAQEGSIWLARWEEKRIDVKGSTRYGS